MLVRIAPHDGVVGMEVFVDRFTAVHFSRMIGDT